ncbi:MAG: SPOR domain-containing protein [Rhodospirillales bacterium]
MHWVQAGAFADPGRAAAVRRRLAPIGPTVTSSSMIAGRSLLRVRVGPLYSEAEARHVLASVSRAGFPDSRIVDD